MRHDIRPISLESLPDVVRVMNESSAGKMFAFHLDVMQFLMLARFWNFSYAHSYLAYVNEQPAGILLNSVNPPSKELYTFYWGVVPEHRNRGPAAALNIAMCEQGRREGYVRLLAEQNPDSPSSILRKLGYRLLDPLVELESRTPQIPPSKATFEIRHLLPDDLFSLYQPAEDEFQFWPQRPFFVRAAARFFEIMGAFAGDRLVAHAIASTHPGNTVVIALRPSDAPSDAVHALIRYMMDKGYPPPFVVSCVPQSSPCQRLLEAAGFTVTKVFTPLIKDVFTRVVRPEDRSAASQTD